MSDQTQIRVGVIGVGFMGQVHTSILRDIPGVDLVGVADPNEEVARNVAQRFSIGNVYTDPEDLIAGVDAVIISSPETAHADNAVPALEAGKHVFLEKPIADTAEAGKRILDAADRSSSKFLM